MAKYCNWRASFAARSCSGFRSGTLHFVAALHLAHQQFGIAANAQSGDVVRGGVIERGEQREIFGDVVGLAADIFRELEDDFSLGIAQELRRRRLGRDCRATRRQYWRRALPRAARRDENRRKWRALPGTGI